MAILQKAHAGILLEIVRTLLHGTLNYMVVLMLCWVQLLLTVPSLNTLSF